MDALPKPTREQLAENHGPRIIAACLTVAVLATIAVALRFFARALQKVRIGVDDYLILLALPFGWGTCAGTIVAVKHGLGRHDNTLFPHELLLEEKTYFATEVIWAVAIGLIKMSILLLYVRIFGLLRYMRYLAYGIGTFTTCWSIIFILVCLFQCRPMQLNWNKTVPGTCINAWLFFVIGSSINVITDLVILVLPMPATWGLQLSKLRRISVMGIFLLGSLTTGFSLVRLIMVIKDNGNLDFTWANGMVAVWSTAEPCLGIVAACLPTIRPFFTKIFLQFASFQSRLSYYWNIKKVTGSSSTGATQPMDRAYGDLQPLQELHADPRVDTFITSGQRTEDSVLRQGTGFLPDAIELNTVRTLSET